MVNSLQANPLKANIRPPDIPNSLYMPLLANTPFLASILPLKLLPAKFLPAKSSGKHHTLNIQPSPPTHQWANLLQVKFLVKCHTTLRHLRCPLDQRDNFKGTILLVLLAHLRVTTRRTSHLRQRRIITPFHHRCLRDLVQERSLQVPMRRSGLIRRTTFSRVDWHLSCRVR